MYSTGSPLSAASFDFVYEHIHPGVMLSSITGEFLNLHSSLLLAFENVRMKNKIGDEVNFRSAQPLTSIFIPDLIFS